MKIVPLLGKGSVTVCDRVETLLLWIRNLQQLPAGIDADLDLFSPVEVCMQPK